MTDFDESGAIDYFVIEFDRQRPTGELVPSLLDLVDRRLIRIMDVVIVLTSPDGSFRTLTSDQLDPAEVGDLGALAGASSGLLGHDDAAEVAAIMDPETAALVVVYENLWSLPFASAARRAGGQLIGYGHVPTQAIAAALDVLDA
jgi:hypothetical protein